MATKKTTPKIQDAPFKGQVSKEQVQTAIKAVKTKRNIDPGRPVSRPQAPPPKDTNWGKTLTKTEWVKLMKKLDAKKKAREATKIAEKKK